MTDLILVPRTTAAIPARHLVLRSLTIGLMAFLTVVDLFAAQAILPSLAAHYGVMPGAMGLAVNASTIGMAIAGLVVGLFSPSIERRSGILLSLGLLAIPTACLAYAPNLAIFTALRIAQGLCMSAAFALTLAYLGEHFSRMEAGSAFAAYITGNVASNLFGRLLSAALVDTLGLAWNFWFFAFLNLGGAALIYFTVSGTRPGTRADNRIGHPLAALAGHLRNPALRAAFSIGFAILFAFIGTFTYVNFVLIRPPLSLDRMQLGIVYLVFAPSIVTTLLAGRAVDRFGARTSLWGGLALAALGLPLLLQPHLWLVLAGLTLVGIGSFFAQAVATGFVGRAATVNRGVASGFYLACYFAGGLAGTAILGQLFDAFGWTACVGGVLAALLAAMFQTRRVMLAK